MAGADCYPDLSERCNIAEINVAGDNKPSHMGVKLSPSSEGSVLKYVSREIKGDTLFITQKSDKIEVVTAIKSYEGTSALRVNTAVTNVSGEDIVLESVSAFCLPNVGKRTFENAKNSYFTLFNQSHHFECQPFRRSFFDYGFTGNAPASQKKDIFCQRRLVVYKRNFAARDNRKRRRNSVYVSDREQQFLVLRT